jgi:hypothetical protein
MAVTSCAGAMAWSTEPYWGLPRGPVLALGANHIDDGHPWIHLSGALGHFLVVELRGEIDVGDERPICGFVALYQRSCFFAGGCNRWFNPPSESASKPE